MYFTDKFITFVFKYNNMATILDKDVSRESTEKVDGREVQVTLTADQKISLKLKGLKSGTLDISISELFKQLSSVSIKKPVSIDKGGDDVVQSDIKNDLSSYKGDSKFLISIHDIRHAINASDMDLETTIKFDNFLSNLIKERKKQKK